MSEGTVHPLVQPVGHTHASGAFDWRAVPSADPRTSAFALDTAPALPAAAEEFSGEACREIVEDLLDRTRTGACRRRGSCAVLRVQMRRLRLLAACL